MEKLFDGEYKLMEVLWEVGAVRSAQLVELCAQRLGWNKSTTYTVLRRLKNKGAVDHRDTVVTPLLTRAAAIRAEGAELERRAVPPKVRHATRPSRAARARRMDEKSRRGQIKRLRGRVDED